MATNIYVPLDVTDPIALRRSLLAIISQLDQLTVAQPNVPNLTAPTIQINPVYLQGELQQLSDQVAAQQNTINTLLDRLRAAKIIV